VLTIDFDRLGVHAGARVLDLGSGPGRHAFEACRRGAHVVCADLLHDDLQRALATLTAMADAGEAPSGAAFAAARADAVALPFADGSFDHVIAAEVLEHVPADRCAMREIARVLRPGGHARIYRARELRDRLGAAGLRVTGTDHVHALHAPYWWLRCLVGPDDERAWPVRQYHRFLVWDITRRPRAVRLTERVLDPLIGKSLVVYCAA